MSTVTIASDYASLRIPSQDLSFYFGYERTDPNFPDVWCFEMLARNGSMVVSYTFKALDMKDKFDVTDGLLRGIAKVISDGHLHLG
jgi:hypothetical protein